jgi:hypothetical protein
MTKALDLAIKEAASLPDEEQDKLASFMREQAQAMRQRLLDLRSTDHHARDAQRKQMQAWLERVRREGKFRGRRDELMAGVREFREGFVFKHDLEEGSE